MLGLLLLVMVMMVVVVLLVLYTLPQRHATVGIDFLFTRNMFGDNMEMGALYKA